MERHQWKNGDIARLKEDNGKRWQISKTDDPKNYKEWFISEIRESGIAGGWVSTWTLDNEYEFVNNPVDDAQEAIKKEFDKIRECVKESSWSEEDERRVEDTIYFLETAKKHYASTVEFDACIDWLKSLKPQNTWKPNDEQIKAIRLARSFVTDDFGDNPTLSEILIELEKQLKKLKENKL